MKTLRAVLLLLAFLPVARLSAQHGGMPPPDKAEKPATFAFAAGVKEDPQVAAFMTGFAAALHTQDGRPMIPALAENYLIEGYGADKNHREGFVGAMGMLPSPSKIRVTAIKAEGELKIVTAEFSFPTRVSRLTFQFDAAGKLLTTDFISMKRPPAPAKPAGAPAEPEHH